MLPGGEPAPPAGVYEQVAKTLQRERALGAVRMTFRGLNQPGAVLRDLSRLADLDPENGIFAYLQLFAHLPSAPATAPAGQAPEQEELLRALQGLSQVRPARLHALDQRELVRSTFEQAGLPPRRAALHADIHGRGYSGVYRPVLGRWADALLRQGASWREAGRPRDATIAHGAVARLFMDLVDDSPMPDLVLLASDRVGRALRELAADQEAAGAATASSAGEFLAAAERVESCGRLWHERGRAREVNLIPITGEAAVAPEHHDHIVASAVAAAVGTASWLTLALISLVLLVLARPWRPAVDLPSWRWRGRGRWVAAAVEGTLLAGALLFLHWAPVPWTWLISLPTAYGAAMTPWFAVAVVGLSVWAGVDRPAPLNTAAPTRRTVIALAVVVLAIVLACTFAWPVRTEPWRAPAAIVYWRRLSFFAGVAALVLSLAWIGGGYLRRRRMQLPVGRTARVGFEAAAWAWLVVSILTFASLVVDYRADRAHQQAFVTATADPLADRLGGNWKDVHFSGVRPLLDRLDLR